MADETANGRKDRPRPIPLLLEGVAEGQGSDIEDWPQAILVSSHRLIMLQNELFQLPHHHAWMVDDVIVCRDDILSVEVYPVEFLLVNLFPKCDFSYITDLAILA